MKFVNHDNFELEQYRLSANEYLLKVKTQPKPVILDIRTPENISEGTIEGAYSLPHNEFEDRMIQLPPFGSIILYSDSENSNINSTLKLLWENGFSDMFFVDGGYLAIMAALFDYNEVTIKNFENYLKQTNKTAFELDIGVYHISYNAIDKELDPKIYKKIGLHGVALYFKHRQLRLVEGTILKWQDDAPKFDHPRLAEPKPETSVKDRVQEILDSEINPSIASHGGYVKLAGIEDDIAYIEMLGGCQGCGMSAVTLKHGIESVIFQRIPEIAEILDATDHDAGANPYYQKETSP